MYLPSLLYLSTNSCFLTIFSYCSYVPLALHIHLNRLGGSIAAIGLLIGKRSTIGLLRYCVTLARNQDAFRFMGPTYGAHLGPVGPRWAHVGPINLAIRVGLKNKAPQCWGWLSQLQVNGHLIVPDIDLSGLHVCNNLVMTQNDSGQSNSEQ